MDSHKWQRISAFKVIESQWPSLRGLTRLKKICYKPIHHTRVLIALAVLWIGKLERIFIEDLENGINQRKNLFFRCR